MESETENYLTLTIPGKLVIKYVNGQYGPFPVGTLYSPIGMFAVRDKWMETFDAGEYEGDFEVAEIRPYTYQAFGEVRTAIRAIIESFNLNDYDTEVEPEPELQPDPIEEDEGSAYAQVVEVDTRDNMKMVNMLFSYLDSDSWWEVGDDYVIDSSIGRENIRACREALLALGYKFDPKGQKYVYVGEEV